jgi:hypothetical protein
VCALAPTKAGFAYADRVVAAVVAAEKVEGLGGAEADLRAGLCVAATVVVCALAPTKAGFAYADRVVAAVVAAEKGEGLGGAEADLRAGLCVAVCAPARDWDGQVHADRSVAAATVVVCALAPTKAGFAHADRVVVSAAGLVCALARAKDGQVHADRVVAAVVAAEKGEVLGGAEADLRAEDFEGDRRSWQVQQAGPGRPRLAGERARQKDPLGGLVFVAGRVEVGTAGRQQDAEGRVVRWPPEEDGRAEADAKVEAAETGRAGRLGRRTRDLRVRAAQAQGCRRDAGDSARWYSRDHSAPVDFPIERRQEQRCFKRFCEITNRRSG